KLFAIYWETETCGFGGKAEDENLWIASRMIWFNQPEQSFINRFTCQKYHVKIFQVENTIRFYLNSVIVAIVMNTNDTNAGLDVGKVKLLRAVKGLSGDPPASASRVAEITGLCHRAQNTVICQYEEFQMKASGYVCHGAQKDASILPKMFCH
ncbi:hypothetical protein STEG23_027442, partial [Scotinomys teguina]